MSELSGEPSKRISVGLLRPNMLIKENVHDVNGRLLLEKGSRLTEKHIRFLKMWSVLEVVVDDNGKLEDSSKNINISKTEHVKSNNYAEECFINWKSDSELKKRLKHLFVNRFLKEGEMFSYEKENASLYPLITRTDSEIRARLKRILNGEIELHALPELVAKVNDAINDPTGTALQIANILEKDPVLCARLLKIVNSAMYGFPQKIESVARAVTIVGPRQVYTLVVAASVISVFDSIPPELLNMRLFWKHSVACGITARLIAGYKKVVKTERYFLGGMLHDIGRLVLLNYFPEEYKEVLKKHFRLKKTLSEAENEIFGKNHSQVGEVLMTKWNLPSYLSRTCLYHPDPSKNDFDMMTLVIHISDILVNVMGFGCSGQRLVPELSEGAWEKLGLPLTALDIIVPQAEFQLGEVFQYFLGE